jgi:hypothetical protein
MSLAGFGTSGFLVTRSVLFLLATVFSTGGCAPDADLEQAAVLAGPSDALQKIEGTPAAVGLLAFLNDEGTTLDLLDHEVPLDHRAAVSLARHRLGKDGTWGTSDDNLFDSVDEVDGCYWVGPNSIERLLAYAEAEGFTPGDDDHLGTWNGVSFTVAEAAAVVELANTAGPNTLDDTIALDSRAADSIVNARPVSSVYEMAGLYYVGKSALTKLKDYAEGEAGCDVPGWEIEYVYADDAEAWEDRLPAGLVALVDEVVGTDDWCGEATGEPWFVKATIDRFECEEKGYTLELGQGMLEYPEISWYIEFEVDVDFGFGYVVCEV